MEVQVLVATMQQYDHSLLDIMNIQSDAIVGNQCKRNYIENFTWNGYKIKYLNFNERGVGINRNNALMRATADICLFADDDMRYYDNYPDLVKRAFEKHPDADVIIFNLKESMPTRYIIRKDAKVNCMNYMRYGTARIAIKLRSVKVNSIYFNQCFGGGSEYRHGEDTLFLTECLRKKLKIYAVPEFIAELLHNRSSTWDKGYDDKFFVDQGALYKNINKGLWRLLCLQDAIRHQKLYKLKWHVAYKKMTKCNIA